MKRFCLICQAARTDPKQTCPNPLRSFDSLPRPKKRPPAPVIASQPHDFNIPDLTGTVCQDSSADPNQDTPQPVRRFLTRHATVPGATQAGRGFPPTAHDPGGGPSTGHARPKAAPLGSFTQHAPPPPCLPRSGMTFSPPCRGHPSARGMSYDDKVRKLAAPFDEALAHTRRGEVA